MSIDDRVTKDDVDNLLEVFEKEQLQRLGALQAVQPLLLRTKRAGSGPLSQAAAVQKLDVLDLHALAQWVIDGKDPWRPEPDPMPVPAFPEGTVLSTAQPFEVVGEFGATVTEEDDGIHVRFDGEGDGDPDHTTDLDGERTELDGMSGDVYKPHRHPDEEGLWTFKDELGKCVPMEPDEPQDADGPE